MGANIERILELDAGEHPRPVEFAAALRLLCLGLLKEYSRLRPDERRLKSLLEASDA